MKDNKIKVKQEKQLPQKFEQIMTQLNTQESKTNELQHGNRTTSDESLLLPQYSISQSETERDAYYARQVAYEKEQEENNQKFVLAFTAQTPPNYDFTSNFNYNYDSKHSPALNEQKQITWDPFSTGPLIPIYSPDGLHAQIAVETHRLPPRLTKQYATAGYPGAATHAITTPQDHSITYSLQTVPLQEAIILNTYGNGVRVEEPYDSNSRYSFFGISMSQNYNTRTRYSRGVLVPQPPRKYRWWGMNKSETQ